MNYREEYNKVESYGNFWKPIVGVYKITLLSEMSELIDSKKFKDKKESSIKIKVNNEEKIWTMTVGGKNSVYGQLIIVGNKYNTLSGQVLNVLVKMDNEKKREYTIQEAIEIESQK